MTVNPSYQKLFLKSKILFFLILLSFIYGVFSDFSDKVRPTHQWRKADSLSITYNYFLGESFFSPKTNWINENQNRNAVAEFPIIYFVVGNIWKITGKNETIFRLLGLSLLFLSILLISEVINHYLQSDRLTIFLSCFLYTSPVLISYTHNFIPNPFSFSLLLISGYLLFKFIYSNRTVFIILFFITISLSILIKVTVLIAVLSFIGAALIFLFLDRKKLLNINKKQAFIISISLFLSLVVAFFWYRYAINYNFKHQSTLFSTTIRPYWDLSPEERDKYYEGLFNVQLSMLYSKWLLGASFLFSIYILFKKQVALYFKLFVLVSLSGIFFYFVLWFWVFDVHDYYMIEIIYFPATLMFIFFYYKRTLVKSKLVHIFILTLFLISFLHSLSFARLSMLKRDIITINSPFISNYIRRAWFWEKYNFEQTLDNFLNQKNEIQKLISRSEKVLCISDKSPNLYLYSIERFGYSGFDFNSKDSLELKKYLEKDVNFIIQVGEVDHVGSQNKKFLREIYNKNSVVIYQRTK